MAGSSPPSGRDGATRFHLALGNPLLRLLLLLFFTRRSNSYVEVSEEAVEFRMGPLFRLRVATGDVTSTRERGWPWLLGWGWRFDLRGTVGLIGTRSGVVEVSLRRPRWVWLAAFPVRCRRVAVSVEEPRALLEALPAPVKR